MLLHGDVRDPGPAEGWLLGDSGSGSCDFQVCGLFVGFSLSSETACWIQQKAKEFND